MKGGTCIGLLGLTNKEIDELLPLIASLKFNIVLGVLPTQYSQLSLAPGVKISVHYHIDPHVNKISLLNDFNKIMQDFTCL